MLSAGFRKRRRRKDEDRKGQEPPGHRGQGGDRSRIGREEDRNRDCIQDRLCKDDGLKGGEGTLLRGKERGLRAMPQRLCKEDCLQGRNNAVFFILL